MEDRSDRRLTTMISEHERQRTFADFVAEMRREEDGKRRELKRTENADKENFRDFLSRRSKDGLLSTTSTWDIVKDEIIIDQSYTQIAKHGERFTRDVFDDFMKDLVYTYRHDKAFIVHLLSTNKIDLVPSACSTYEDFVQLLLSTAGKTFESECKKVLQRESIASAKIFFEEILVTDGSASLLETTLSKDTEKDDNDSSDDGEISEDGEVCSEDGEIQEEGELPSIHTVLKKRRLLK